MTDLMSLREALSLPQITDAAGVTHTATRRVRFRDGLVYMEAVESRESMPTQLREAHRLLVNMGFPAEMLDELDVDQVVEYATRFFTDAFRRNGIER